MKNLLFILYIVFTQLGFGQEHAYLSFKPNWKATSFSKEHKWVINGKMFKLSEDTIKIHINENGLDTIRFKFKEKDTDWKESIARFKPNNHYIIRQIPCTDYDIVSNDTSVTSKHQIRFHLKGYHGIDTVAGIAEWNYTTPLKEGEKTDFIEAETSLMCANTRRDIAIRAYKPGVYSMNQPMAVVNGQDLVKFSYQFLHNEKLELTYDHQSRKHQIIVNEKEIYAKNNKYKIVGYSRPSNIKIDTSIYVDFTSKEVQLDSLMNSKELLDYYNLLIPPPHGGDPNHATISVVVDTNGKAIHTHVVEDVKNKCNDDTWKLSTNKEVTFTPLVINSKPYITEYVFKITDLMYCVPLNHKEQIPTEE